MEEIQEVNSADQIDKLNALRSKLQSGKFNLSRPNSGKISENEMPGMRKEMTGEETHNKYGGDAREVEIDAIGKHWALVGIRFSEIPDGGL